MGPYKKLDVEIAAFSQYMLDFLRTYDFTAKLLPTQCLLVIGGDITLNLINIIRDLERTKFEITREAICWTCGKEEICKKVG